MSQLQEVINEAKSHLDKGFVFVHVKDHWLRAFIDGLEETQRENAAMKERCVKLGIFRALRHFQQQGLCDGYEYEEIEEFINDFY